MKSPLDVSYDDVIKELERNLSRMKLVYPGLVTTGKMHNWTARHRISVYEILVKVVKKHKKNPQLNLEDLFKEVPKAKVIPMPPGPDKVAVQDPDLFEDPDLYTSLEF